MCVCGWVCVYAFLMSGYNLPPMQGLRITNGARGVKRSGGPLGAEREGEESIRKWQSRCNAPWSTMLEGAIERFGPLLMGHCKRDQALWYHTGEVTYEHPFCWRDKDTGEMHYRMSFIVYARYLPDQQAYQFRPGLKSEKGSLNNWLWSMMRQELGQNSLIQRVQCSDNPARLRAALDSFLRPWLMFFAREFQTL